MGLDSSSNLICGGIHLSNGLFKFARRVFGSFTSTDSDYWTQKVVILKFDVVAFINGGEESTTAEVVTLNITTNSILKKYSISMTTDMYVFFFKNSI